MPVTIGCAVILTPGAAGPPDSGVIIAVPQVVATAGGMPLAVQGSICQMVNSMSGVPYPLPIGAPVSPGIRINNMAVIRMGDLCPSGSGIIQVVGPPAAPYINDTSG
ncbi:MAG: hypothetical protein WCB49_10060 [Gammaproteobacteria bacterium]